MIDLDERRRAPYASTNRAGSNDALERTTLSIPGPLLNRLRADADVLAVTERLGEPELATLDRRHFGTLRPLHVDALTLLPLDQA